MKMRQANYVGELETSEIRCDCCGFESRLELGLSALFEIQEFVTVGFVAGYGATVFDDGDRYEADLCQRCIKSLLGPYLRCYPDPCEMGRPTGSDLLAKSMKGTRLR